MTIEFWVLVALLLGLASAFVLWPLWRVDLPGGAAVAGVGSDEPRHWLGVWLVTGLAAGTVLLYCVVGHPQGMEASTSPSSSTQQTQASGQALDAASPNASEQGAGPSPAQIEAMVQRLATRLQAQPDDVAGWEMLIKSYETLGRFDQAVLAYRNLMRLKKTDADMLSNYAVALGMSQGRRLSGEPEAALNQALKLDPRHPQALGLAADAAYEREDYPLAIQRWRQLLAHLPADEPLRQQVQALIDKAQSLQARNDAKAKKD